MHVTRDILDTVGQVSVKMQSPACILLDIPDFYQQLRAVIFSVTEWTTPMVSQFIKEYNSAELKWKGIKLRGARIQRGDMQHPQETVQQILLSLVGGFLDDLKHNLLVRFGPYTHPGCLLSKFQIFHPKNWPVHDEDMLRAYGNEQLKELLLKSPNEGIGDFFTTEEIRLIRNLWPLFKVTIKHQALSNNSPLEFYQYFFRSPYF
jgi:hypothetical protein